ncbi:ferritin-like domain-containing protein [Emcibacter nanhaiensis]|uniref:DUF2202 domain-containing protein n=1 Tax=Emcibacter nanhaiensis TaxID=1505037 RepID=A0A501PBI4_9PROT|nr:DUF2202 domain-containing protein [Emcibacter nanhaiensis]TPD57362.1 DUF2202 domain-containing protein [Emcibacter nanhaiensis]
MAEDYREETRKILEEALDDEYKARATYAKVIEKFGPVRPFINIVEAENRHAGALLRQFERLGLIPPEDQWAGNVEAPETLVEACKGGIEAEIENAEMYDRLLAAVNDPMVRNVLLRLQEASQNNHLSAFRRCLTRLSSSQEG